MITTTAGTDSRRFWRESGWAGPVSTAPPSTTPHTVPKAIPPHSQTHLDPNSSFPGSQPTQHPPQARLLTDCFPPQGGMNEPGTSSETPHLLISGRLRERQTQPGLAPGLPAALGWECT